MRCGAPGLTLTAYVQLGAVDGPSGSGSMQLEVAVSFSRILSLAANVANLLSHGSVNLNSRVA